MENKKNTNPRLVQKHDLEVNWLKATKFIPKRGEIIVYDIDDNHNYERINIGDGVSTVNELLFTGQEETITIEEIDEICGDTLPGAPEEFIDESTNIIYRLYVENGKLSMEEV